MSKWARLSQFCIVALLQLGCSTAPIAPKTTLSQQLLFDIDIGDRLAQRVEPNLTVVKLEPAVSDYLVSLARKLVQTSALADRPVFVQVISDLEGVWRNESLPGTRIYLSRGLARVAEFESVLAASIAFELGHVIRRHVVKSIEQEVSLNPEYYQEKGFDAYDWDDFFGPGGILNYSQADNGDAIEEAVQLLYAAGYDPRGLAGLWSIYQSQPSKSPFDSLELAAYQEKTHQALSQRPPLLNPTVQSEKFLALRTQLRKI